MRITGGIYKNRKLFVPEGDAVRPTSDRMRQTLFNIMHHASWLDGFDLRQARALDLFCGSGALGLEALSNGAIHCVFVDKDTTAIQKNSAFLNKDDFRIIKSNALTIGAGQGDINLVFLDPPYRQGLVEPSIQNLIEKKWLADGAIIIVETEKNYSFNIDLEVLDKRSQSQSDLNFLRYNHF
jgi:16S rRNA (guanine966-N2)-methyltransferase